MMIMYIKLILTIAQVVISIKKYLVTGASGFIGASLVRKLVKNNEDVHITLRKESHNWRLKDIENLITIHYCDLADENVVRDLLEKNSFNVIFNLATYGGYNFQKNNDTIINTNVIVPWNLIKICKETGVEIIINTSSSSEYGEKFEAMKEDMILNPNNMYGASKASATLLCSTYAKINKIPLCTFRLFSPYGYYDAQSRLIPSVINYCLENKDIYLGNKKSKRDFIFIDDVIDAYLEVLNYKNKYGEIYNVGSGIEYTIESVVDKIKYLTNSKSILQWGNKFDSRQYEPEHWYGDINKIKEELNWSPKINIDDGLSRTIEWVIKNKNFYK